MQQIITIIYKIARLFFVFAFLKLSKLFSWIIFYGNNIDFINFSTIGVPFVSIARGGVCRIGESFRMNNGNIGNPIGRPQRCVLFVDKGAELVIGNNVGISSVALVCYDKITIGDYVKIGGGVCIYDTDFHSLDPESRRNSYEDKRLKKNSPVVISDNVFIGAHSTILKGVSIGENSIIGAGSVVTRCIPSNEIWGGNPATLIRKL